MKKLLIILGVLAGLFLAAIIIIPLVVDVDQYRPQVVQAINEKINGKMELGKLNLKMWGTIKVGIAGLHLIDAKNRKVISVQSAEVVIPWSSIFGGSPLLTFQMDRPEVQVIKDLNGKMNIMTLMKEDAPGDEAEKTNDSTGSKASSAADKKLPSVVTNARLGVELTRASFKYSDLITKNDTQAKDLNLSIKDLSISRETEMKLSGELAAAQEDAFKVSGPFVVHMTAEPNVSGGKLQSMAMEFNGDFGDLEIQAGDAFHKKRGVKAKFDGKISVTPQDLTISKLGAQFFNAEISIDGKVTNLGTEGQDPIADIEIKSNTIDLAPWNELVPMLKEYSLSGTASLNGYAKGPSSKLQYGGDLLVKNLKAKSEYLKSEPVVNMSVKITTDKVEKFLATLSAPGNDLKIEGDVVSFSQPKVTLNVTSQSMDLDQLIKFPEPVKKGDNGNDESGKSAAAGGKKAAEENLDAMLDPMRANPIMNSMVALATTNIKLIKFYDIAMTGFQSKASMKNLVASVDQASVSVFNGKITMKASTSMKPKTPTYQFSAAVTGLDLQKAVTSKLELLKNTVIGKLTMKIDGSGASYNTDAAIKNLNSRGSFKVEDAVFTAIDVGKMASDGINKALEKVGDKVPGLKGKSVKGLDKGNSKYQYVSTDFTIQNGVFSAPNFSAKAYPNTGLDLRGATSVNLINEELKADWEISDPSNMTKVRDISVNIAGREVPGILANDGKIVILPITIGCKYTNPCPSYGKLAEHFSKVALDNTKDKAKEVVKEEVKDKAKEVGKKLLKGLFNK
jgi:hypothetical protein